MKTVVKRVVKTAVKLVATRVVFGERTRQAARRTDRGRDQVCDADALFYHWQSIGGLAVQRTNQTNAWNQMGQSRRNILPFSRLRERARIGFQKTSQKPRGSLGEEPARVTSKPRVTGSKGLTGRGASGKQHKQHKNKQPSNQGCNSDKGARDLAHQLLASRVTFLATVGGSQTEPQSQAQSHSAKDPSNPQQWNPHHPHTAA